MTSTGAGQHAGRLAALVAIAVAAMYGVVVTATFALSDDVYLLWTAGQDDTTILRGSTGIGAGRTLFAAAFEIAYSLATDLASVRWIRLVGLLGIALTGWAMAMVWRSAGWSAPVSAAVAVMGLSGPAFQVIAVWGALYPEGYGLAAGLAAGALAVGLWGRHWGRWALAGSAAALLVALQTYQPAAMSFWVPLAVVIGTADRFGRAEARTALRTIAVFGATTAVYLATMCLGQALGGEAPSEHRELSLQAIGKLGWFAQDVLPRVLAPWSLQPGTAAAVVIGAAVVVGLALRPSGVSVAARLAYVAALALLVPLAYLPNLVVAERWPAARTRPALELVVVTLAVLALDGALRRVARGRADRALAPLMCVVALGCGAIATHHVRTYFVEPLRTELRDASALVRTIPIVPGRPLYVIAADWNDTTAPAVVFDEFGLPMLAKPWSAGHFVEMELERTGRPAPRVVVVVTPHDVGCLAPGATVVDLGALRPGQDPFPLSP